MTTIRSQYEILVAEYIAHAEEDDNKVSEMFKGDAPEKHKSKGWTNAMPKTNKKAVSHKFTNNR